MTLSSVDWMLFFCFLFIGQNMWATVLATRYKKNKQMKNFFFVRAGQIALGFDIVYAMMVLHSKYLY